jgi:hypothetical protein
MAKLIKPIGTRELSNAAPDYMAWGSLLHTARVGLMDKLRDISKLSIPTEDEVKGFTEFGNVLIAR